MEDDNDTPPTPEASLNPAYFSAPVMIFFFPLIWLVCVVVGVVWYAGGSKKNGRNMLLVCLVCWVLRLVMTGQILF